VDQNQIVPNPSRYGMSLPSYYIHSICHLCIFTMRLQVMQGIANAFLSVRLSVKRMHWDKTK